MPQIVYYASAYAKLVDRGALRIGNELDICVPTGNFGNILAAYYAKAIGVPISAPMSTVPCKGLGQEAHCRVLGAGTGCQWW